MKAVLVIDTPKRCDECPLCYDSWFCIITDIDIEKIYDDIDLEYTCPIPSWCPLKELPMPYTELDMYWKGSDYVEGFNECLKEITGETE